VSPKGRYGPSHQKEKAKQEDKCTSKSFFRGFRFQNYHRRDHHQRSGDKKAQSPKGERKASAHRTPYQTAQVSRHQAEDQEHSHSQHYKSNDFSRMVLREAVRRLPALLRLGFSAHAARCLRFA